MHGAIPQHPLARWPWRVVFAVWLAGLVYVSRTLGPCCSTESVLLTNVAQIYPIDSAKSIYQRNVLAAGYEKAKSSPIQFFNRRMYRGLGVSMSRSCVINMIFFSVFEMMKKKINRLEIEDE